MGACKRAVRVLRSPACALGGHHEDVLRLRGSEARRRAIPYPSTPTPGVCMPLISAFILAFVLIAGTYELAYRRGRRHGLDLGKRIGRWEGLASSPVPAPTIDGNGRCLTCGSMARGVLELKGRPLTDAERESLREEWRARHAGTRIPPIVLEPDARFDPTRTESTGPR